MKKLIAMIGAVAMSFCAFAATMATPIPYSLSFEAAEGSALGVDTSAMTFSPTNVTGWTWEPGDPLQLRAYAGDAYTYGTPAANTRRDGMFLDQGAQYNYLELDTGTSELARDMGDGNIVVDQLVKFTGFEEPQTNLTAGIGVWMSEFVTNDTDEVATTDLTETNLYVTCAQVGSPTKPVALKIAGTFELNKWYRLTIKSIGDIYGGAAVSDAARLGFLVYIDGQKASSSDSAAATIVSYGADMTSQAKKFMGEKRLFPAIDTPQSLAVTTVGFKGVGFVDDIIIDDVGPSFAQETLPVTVAPIEGVAFVVADADGNPVAADGDGKYNIMPGPFTVTYTALADYKIVPNPTVVNHNTDEGIAINDSEDVVPAVVVATVTRGVTTTKYAKAELYAAFNALVVGDQVAIVKDCDVTNGEEDVLYTFTPNTMIDVAADGWDVFVRNYVDEEVTAGKIEVYEDIAADRGLSVVFEDGDQGELKFGGSNVNGTLEATNGTVNVSANIKLGAAGVLKAADLKLGNPAIQSLKKTVTLSGAAKVMTTVNTFTAEQIIPGDGELDITGPDADGYYTYQIAAAPGTFKVTVPGLTAGLEFVAMTNGEEEVTEPTAGDYTVNEGDTFTVVYAPAEGYEFTKRDEDGVREATKDSPTITPPEVALKVFEVEFVDGANSTINPPVGTSNLVWGTEITVTATAAENYEFANESYEGWKKQEDGTLKTNVTVTAAATFTAPAATRQMVAVTLPTVTIDGVSSLVVSQKVNEVWEDVTATKLIGAGNEYVVVAIPAADYRASNPITNGTAAVGTSITVTEQQVKDKVSEINYVAQVSDVKYETLAEAVAVDGDVTLLKSVTLTETLTIAKAKALNLAGKAITFGDALTQGIKITVDGVAITNGTIDSSLTANAAMSKAIEVAYANATFKDLTINAGHYEYAIYANCDEACQDSLAWFYTQSSFKKLDCDSVTITGNGSLFHVEGMEATLKDCSATGFDSDLFANAAHQAAVYSAVNARTTITGSGVYTHVNALQSGNLGGKITVAEGSDATFTGNIKSYMKLGAHTELEDNSDYKAEFVFNAGTYTGNIVFEDANARTLDSFTKGVTVTIAAPEGYIWFNDTKLGKPIIATFKVDGAVYAAETNIVAFTPQTPEIPPKTGYTAAWNPEVTQISESKEFNAVYTAEQYTIRFISGEGVQTNDISKAYGETIDAPTPAEVTGKSFKEWSPAVVSPVVGNAEYTAVYTNNQYTLTIPTVEHASAVVSNATEQVETRTFDYGTVVTVYWTAKAGWKITEGATEQITMNDNITANAPVVEKAAEPVVPGGEIDCDDDEAAQNLAKSINEDTTGTLKAQYLKAPDGATVDQATYNSYFAAQANGSKVTFVLNETGKAALQENVDDEIIKIKPDKIAAGTDTSVKIDPIPGFYYAVKQGNGIGTMKIVEAGVLATSTEELELNLEKYPGAGFYKIVVSEKPIPSENSETPEP